MRDWLRHERVRLYIKLLARLILFGLALWFVIYMGPVVLSYFLPFILAFCMAAAINPLVNLLHRKIRIPHRILSFLLVLLVFFSVGTLIVWFVYTLVRETVSLAKNVETYLEYVNRSLEIVTDNIRWLLDFIPGDTEVVLTEFFDAFIPWLQDNGRAMADYAVANTVPLTTKVGSGVIATIVFIMAAYFITADYSRLAARMRSLLGTRVYSGYDMVKSAALSALGRYLRAQLFLALIAFIFMLAGLLILGQDYALLLALILAILDFLPFIGTGIMLAPWGIICILGNDIGKGVFLLALSFAFFLIRRFVEPKIVSQQSGLSPLSALICIYLGMRIAGVWGMIGGPILAMIVISVYKAGFFNGFIKDVNTVVRDILQLISHNKRMDT